MTRVAFAQTPWPEHEFVEDMQVEFDSKQVEVEKIGS